MYNTNVKLFEELVQVVIAQIYPYWELCLADGSQNKNEKIEEITKRDDRIKYKFLNENKGIAGNTNEALKMANGEYIVLLDHDDLLSVNALYEIVKLLNEDIKKKILENTLKSQTTSKNNSQNDVESDLDFIYSDEDKITENGERYNPYFKPDFSPETLAVHNYITHLVCFKKSLLEEVRHF